MSLLLHNLKFLLVHTHSEDGCNTIKIISGVSVGCVVVVMVIMLVIVTVVRSKKSHCHDQANNDTTDAGTQLPWFYQTTINHDIYTDVQTNPNPAYEMVTF